MDNTGNPNGGSHELPGTKTRLIGRIPTQTALIDKTPLTGFIFRREGQKNPSATKDKQNHPPAQTSFRQSDAPQDPTFTPQTKGGDSSHQTDRPTHQTSFPQSEFPNQDPSPSVEHQNPGHTAPNPQTQSFTNVQQPHGHSKTDGQALTKSQDHTLFSARPTPTPFTSSASSQFHDHGSSLPITSQSALNTANTDSILTVTPTSKVASTESSKGKVSGHRGGKLFSLITQSTHVTSSSSLIAANTASISTATSPSKGASTESGKGNFSGHHKGTLHPPHPNAVTSSIALITTSTNLVSTTTQTSKNTSTESGKGNLGGNPHRILSSISLSISSLSSSTPTANSKHSRPPLGPGHKSQASRLFSQSFLPPPTGIPEQTHSSDLSPVSSLQHIHKHQTTTVVLESQATSSTRTTAQVATNSFNPLSKHTSKAQPVPAATPTQHPDNTQPTLLTSILQPLPFTTDPNTQVMPNRPIAVLPTNNIPVTPQPLPTNTLVPTSAGILETGHTTDLSSLKGGFAKELLNTVNPGPAAASAQVSTLDGIPLTRSEATQSAVGSVALVPQDTSTATDIGNGHHKHSPNTSNVSGSSGSNHSASIIGGVLGAIIALLILGFVLIGFCFYRQKVRKLQKKLQVYEKDGDVAPPLYAPKAFAARGGYDSRAAYGEVFTPENPDSQSHSVVTNPFVAGTYSTQNMHNGGNAFESQVVQPFPVPGYTKSMNPFTDLASSYPYQANGGHRDSASGKDETSVQASKGLSQYSGEENMKAYKSWAALQELPPQKAFDPHLSKMSVGTTASAGTAKRSSTSTYVNDLDENVEKVEFDSLKMVKPRNVAPAAAVGIAM